MRTGHLILLILLFLPILLHAQPFTDLQNGMPTIGNAATAWADYDQDGDPDLAMTGFSSHFAEIGRIYRNDGNGVFVLAYIFPFPVSDGSLSWGDYDHDDDPDLLMTGQNGSQGPPANTVLYRNDGDDVFTPLTNLIPGLIGVARWIDYDHDGWLDVVMSGIGNSFLEDSTRLFHNDTTGSFTEVQVNLPGYLATDISIVDFDNDGDSDFFLVGGTLSSSTFPVTRLFSNEGNGVFTPVPFNFINLSTGTSAWADYDHDGDQDLLYDGLDSTLVTAFTLLYRNDSLGQFTLIDAHLPGSGEPGSVSWADMDHDGDLDILLGGPTTLLRNDGGDVYTDITPDNFLQGVPSSFVDIDHDGDQDILVISSSGGFTASTVHRNDFITAVPHIAEPSDFTLYPNPTGGVLHLSSGGDVPDDLKLVIMNSVGEQVYGKEIAHNAGNDLSINISSLKPALYFYTLLQKGIVIHSGKFMVQ